MIIESNIKKYVIFSEDSILNALQKISDNNHGFILAVNETGVVEGILTDGDFRDWLLTQDNIDLNINIGSVVNKEYLYCNEADSYEEKDSILFHNSHIKCLPILNSQERVVGIAFKSHPKIVLGNNEISDENQAFIIAEIGNNHNGSFEVAKRLVDEAFLAGADCAKFQMRSLKDLYRETTFSNGSEDLGAEYTIDLLNKFQLSDDDLFRIFDYCHEKKIEPLCTPWDVDSFEKLNRYGLAAFKVASADLTNHDLLNEMVKANKPLICSTGMSKDNEIISAVNLFKKGGVQFALLHCNSTYPAPYKDINLKYMARLKEMTGGGVIGYSGHERGFHIPIAAVAKGAKIIEKHFSLDKTMEGNDHRVSLLPDKFKNMVLAIRNVEESIGSGGARKISQGELINRENLAKSIVCACDLKKSDIITEETIGIKSPGQGLPPYKKQELLGRKAKRDISKGDFFYISDIEDTNNHPHDYNFQRKWGIPVRFHDINKYIDKSDMDLFEFHLSYKDLEAVVDEFLVKQSDFDFVVHCPELFTGDHLLDLCSNDESYRKHSVNELQRVIKLTRKLNSYFPKTERPMIVTNVGGFSMDSHITYNKEKFYDILEQSLHELDSDGVEIIPQSMPPFPWHFGGQRYHNLFVDPHEIKAFCKNNDMRICLDVSHSILACNNYRWSISDFIQITAPYVAHLHIADATGKDEEGLQIGDGSVDFPELSKLLNENNINASFIPEIWQGHKNGGEGFWFALNLLEQMGF
jgi:sialic acid synthase SpsE/sugar phosphate isomerase/epimerase